MVSSTYLAIARRREEAGMTDSCTITRATTSGDPDPTTGTTPVASTPIYSGPCEYVAANTEARTVGTGGRDLVEQGAVLKLPVEAAGSAAVRPGDHAVVTLNSHDTTSDPVLVRVDGGHHQTVAVSRRLPVTEVLRG
jgi:hypothetical protein